MSDTNSIHRVFMSIRGGLARAVVGIVPPKEIEDIVQETYVRVCQLESTEDIRQPRSFLYRTARNLALDHAKRAETRLSISTEDAENAKLGRTSPETDQTFDRAVSEQQFARFCEAVRKLPMQCRRAFILRKVYGHSQREIANIMGIAESTVEKHIAKGLKQCTHFVRLKNQAHGSGGAAKHAQAGRSKTASCRRDRS